LTAVLFFVSANVSVLFGRGFHHVTANHRFFRVYDVTTSLCWLPAVDLCFVLFFWHNLRTTSSNRRCGFNVVDLCLWTLRTAAMEMSFRAFCFWWFWYYRPGLYNMRPARAFPTAENVAKAWLRL